ncbi:hypothetical protein BH09BAC1_BH09BAC1_02410 [soil metagenome]
MKYYALLALLLLSISACKKDKDEPIDQTLYATLGTDAGIYDRDGRYMLLRGVNYNVLGDYWEGNPSVPATKRYATADIEQMASYGFNCIRLLFSWSKLEPQPDVYDMAYIGSIKAAIEDAKRNNIYVILDMHQDAWGKYIATPADTVCSLPNKGWDGAPEWATITDGASTCTTDGSRESAPAVYTAFGNFWSNRNGIQDNCVKAWQALIAETAQYQNLVGYDLINEPGFGNVSADEANVQMNNYYARLINAIRNTETASGASQHIVFFELGIGIAGAGTLVVPSPGFTADANIVFAPHSYFESFGSLPFTIENGFDLYKGAASLYHCGFIIGEWGFFGDPATDAAKVKRFAAAEDSYFVGSTWWQWSQAPGDPHGISWDGTSYGATSMHLVELDASANLTGNVNPFYLNILSRTRPNAIVGMPTSLTSNPDTGEMTLEATATGDGITELWIPGRFGTPTINGTNASLKTLREVSGGYIADVNVSGVYTVVVGF